MLLHWLLAASSAALVAASSSKRTFENTNVQRTIELGGSLTHVTTIFTVKALGELPPYVYTLALSELDYARTSTLDVKLKGSAEELKIEELGYNTKSNAYLYSVEMPPMKENAGATLVVNSVLIHASTPFPASIKQGDPQSLKFSTEAYVLSPYKTISERTKIRSPSSKVISFSTPSELSKFAPSSENAKGSRNGAVISYGPFEDLPATTGPNFHREYQQLLTVHYDYETPIVTVVSMDRWAEISHWGNNLNIQDNIHIRNDGPELKGHFSRLELQQSRFYHTPQPQTLLFIPLQLPAGIHQPYFYDSIGNVSTSRYRPAPKTNSPNKHSTATSYLELKPRYPLLGGWNYTYTLGWDAPLGDSGVYDKKTGKYIVGVPFMTPISGAAYDDTSVTIVFPEGAENVAVEPPFSVQSRSNFTHITYLDTIGRPAVVLRSGNLTDQHTGIIYASYTLPVSSHLAKPLAVTTAIFGFFVLGMFFRRVDTSIGTRRVVKS